MAEHKGLFAYCTQKTLIQNKPGGKYLVTYHCYDGGYGWGETNDKVSLIFPDYDVNKFREAHPRGWRMEDVEYILEK